MDMLVAYFFVFFWPIRSLIRMVASYLVHHSYCATAEAFAKSTDQAVHEELASIKIDRVSLHRQHKWAVQTYLGFILGLYDC